MVGTPKRGKKKPSRHQLILERIARYPQAVHSDLPHAFVPALATPVERVPQGGAWLHEMKWDGYRALCFFRNNEVVLISRNGRPLGAPLQELKEELARLELEGSLLDGEIVATSSEGKPNFQLLQNEMQKQNPHVQYFIFDLPYCLGYDLRQVPLKERKEILRQLLMPLKNSELVFFSAQVQGNEGRGLFQQVCSLGMEGVVSKQADSSYIEGRSFSWVKTKCFLRQEFVVAGYTDPGGTRIGFGSLMLGYYDDQGGLHYAGSVGTGFDTRTLLELTKQLKAWESPTCSFVDKPADLRGHWVEPHLVVEVRFAEWTDTGVVRQGAFQGVRQDRDPRDVRREHPQPVSGQNSPQPSFPDSSQGQRLSSQKKKAPARLALSHPEKILFADAGVSKKALVAYYEHVGERMLRFLSGRILALVRCPEGALEKRKLAESRKPEDQRRDCFFQKHRVEGFPESVKHMASPREEGEEVIYVDSLDGILDLAQLGCLEFHAWGSCASQILIPDVCTLDLDPDVTIRWPEVCATARDVRERLEQLGLHCFLKLTGGKGLHLVIPVQPEYEWEDVRAIMKMICDDLMAKFPGRFTSKMGIEHRTGKIFLDYLRNAYGATAIAPYSTRAQPHAPLSLPISWDDLADVPSGDSVTLPHLPEFLMSKRHYPWEGFVNARQSLTPFWRVLRSLKR